MKTFDGYSKEKFSDTSVLLAGGGSKELSNFIGTLNWDSTNRKLQYKKIGDTNWSDLATFGSNALNSTSYLPLTGGTMTGLITTTSGGSHKGIKVGNTYINAIDGNLIFQNNSSIRFGGDSWDYNVWAGLKYVHSSKIIYLGLADNSAFTANSAQSGGKLYLPGISNIYTGNGTNLVWHKGNDGSGSGLDADLLDGIHANGLFTAFSNNGSLTTRITIGGVTKDLKIDADKVDGYHASSLWRSDGATWNPSANISLNASANSQEWSFDIRRNGYTGCYWHVWDSSLSTILKVNADNGKVYAPYNFVGNLEGNASSATKLTSSAGSAILPIYFSDGKPVACTPASLFSNLSNSGNDLSITIAGLNRTLTVNYANNANYAKVLACASFDTASQITTAHAQWTNNSGCSDVPSMGYAAVLNVGYGNYRWWQIWNSRNNHQLFWRPEKGDASGWADVHTLIDDKNISKYLPIVTNYYWANIKVSASSSTSTSPTFATATATTSVITPSVSSTGRLTLNAKNTALDLKFNNDDTKSVILNGTEFKPFDIANGKLDLGASDARWKGLYSGTGNFSGDVTLVSSSGDSPKLNFIRGGSVGDSGGLWDWRMYVHSGHFYLQADLGIGSWTTPFFINSTLHVGIGTTSPTQKLHVNGNAIATNFGVNSTAGSGQGISLYNGSGYVNTYGIAFVTTGNWGTHGYVTADWATYFTMSNTNNRGWIFKRNGSGNVFSIDTSGLVYANGRINGNYFTSRVATGTQPYACTSTTLNTNLNADLLDGYHASGLVKFYLSPMTSGAPADSAKSWFVNTMPSASGAIVYNVPGSEKTIIAGKSSGSYGHMLQLNYDNTYLRMLRYREGSWMSTDWEKISAGYADSAGNADKLDGKHASDFAAADRGVWPIRTYNIALSPTTSWTDTSINSSTTYFPDGEGTYMIFLNPNHSNVTDGWVPRYAGYFVLYTGTNGSETEELLLQAASHASYKRLFLRWINTPNTLGYRKLLIRSESNYSTSYTMIFKFRRII